MYEMAGRLTEMFSVVFQGYCLQYFLGRFLEGRIRNRRINGLAAAVLYAVLRAGTVFFLTTDPAGIRVFAGPALSAAIIILAACVFYRPGGKSVFS